MAHQKGADETLFLDTRGILTRGYASQTTAGNLFIVRHGKLVTPFTNNCLNGVTRQAMMEIAAQEGFRVAEEPLLLSDVYSTQEVFIADTAVEVVPVVTVDNLLIGKAAPGPITRHLAAAYSRYVRVHGTLIYPDQPEMLAA